MNRSLLLLCSSYRLCTCPTVNIIRDCLWVFVVIVFNFFWIYMHACVFFLLSYVCWGAFNIFFIVFHLVFSRAYRTLALCYSEMHAYIATLSIRRSLSVSLFFYFSICSVSPSHPLTLALSLWLHSSFYFCLSFFQFIVLFLPYFSAFVADFEASNTDTQPYQIPYQNNNNNHRNTQFIYMYIVHT